MQLGRIRNLVGVFFLICLIALTAVLLAPRPLPLAIPFSEPDLRIFWNLRLPRTVLGFLAGAVLALGGAVFQSIFRNPLASPYTLGVSAGAAFGASLAIVFNTGGQPGSLSLLCAALAGGIGSSILVLTIGSGRAVRADSLILAGVVVTFFFGSVSLFAQYLADYSKVFALSRWMMGSVGIVGWTELAYITPVVLLGSLWLIQQSASLDLLAFGDEFSFARGVDAARHIPRCVLAVSLLIALIVAVCGPIGFIGIVVPHAARLMGIRRHAALLPACFLLGGCFLLVSDATARSLAYPYELPVGIVTAVIGSPFFLYLLFRPSKHPG